MAPIEVVRNAKLMQDCVERLGKMGGDAPKTINGLEQVLKSFIEKPLISVAEPFRVLNELLNTYGNIKVNVQYPVMHRVKVSKLKKTLFARLKSKAKNTNSRIIPLPVCDASDEFISSMTTWMDQSINRNKQKEPLISAEDFEKQFIKLYFEKQQTVADGAADRILSNLQESGYITIEGDKVTYNFPSAFTLACMTWILRNFKSSSLFSRENQISPSIRQINRHLMKVQKYMKGNLESQMQTEVEEDELSCGVDAMSATSSSESCISYESSPPGTPDIFTKYLKKTRVKDAKGELDYEKRNNVVTRLFGNLENTSWTSTNSYCFVSNELSSLLQGMEKLHIDDVKLVPLDLTLESIYGLLEIGKMGNSRPKTVKALKNGLIPACRVFYHLDLDILFDEVERERDEHEEGGEEGTRKRTRAMMYSRKKKSKTTQITLGREIRVRLMNTNPNVLFLPDITMLIEQYRDDPDNRIYTYSVTNEFNQECQKLIEYVNKHSDQLAQHWSSRVVLGDKQQTTDAAAEIYKWLKPKEKDMKCDGEEEVELVTFTNRDLLFKGIAERCVTLKKEITVQQLVDRLQVDGYIEIDGAKITYPIDQNAQWIYSQSYNKYYQLLNLEWSKYAKMFDDQAQTIVNTVVGSSGKGSRKKAKRAKRQRFR